MSDDGRMDCELEKRIGAALSAAGAARSQVFESRELSRSAKMLMYKAIIEPTLTYGTESWVGEGETENSGSLDESSQEDSRSEENGSCEK